MSYGLLEGVCAALRTGKVTEKAMNEFRKGGALALAAEMVAHGHLTDAALAKFLGTVRIAAASEVKKVVFPQLTHDQLRAAAIMWKRFVSPEAYAKALRLVGISDADLAKLAVVPWTNEELAEEFALGAVLYPHMEGVTLPFLRKTFGTSPRKQPFFRKDSDWWNKDEHKGLRDKTLPTSWRLVRTRLEPNSVNITWSAQSLLIPGTHDRTWELEVVEMATLSYRIFKTRPLENMYAWCEDVDGVGRRACASGYGQAGLAVAAGHPSGVWGDGLLLSRRA